MLLVEQDSDTEIYPGFLVFVTATRAVDAVHARARATQIWPDAATPNPTKLCKRFKSAKVTVGILMCCVHSGLGLASVSLLVVYVFRDPGWCRATMRLCCAHRSANRLTLSASKSRCRALGATSLSRRSSAGHWSVLDAAGALLERAYLQPFVFTLGSFV
jgi:hypothetical protein